MRNNFYLIFLSFLWASCAQQVVPTGGIKDDVPPKVLSYKPDNKSIKFNSDKIIIKFDEYINIKDPGQIIISPLLKDKPTIESNGKQISIAFLQSKPINNTTYTINFSNSIADVNEGNTLNNFSYVFSTGEYLDSNYVTGKIIQAENTKEEKDILIGLYHKANFTDTSVYKNYPNYFSKSKENGRYTIENLPADTFILLAFKDENSDNKYQKTEQVAFLSEPIIPSTQSDSLSLILFKNPLYKENKIVDTLSKQKHVYQFVVYQPNGIIIKPIKHKTYFQNTVKGKNEIDTIQLFLPQSTDSIAEQFEIISTDTSFLISFKTKTRSKLPIEQISIKIPDKPTDTIKLISTIPLDSIPFNKINLLEDTTLVQAEYFKQITPFEWHLYYSYKENKTYTIDLKDSITRDVFGRYTKKASNSFTNKNEKDFGTMALSIRPSRKTNLILQLIELQGNEEIISNEWKGKIPTEVFVKYLKPGNYQLKIIEDTNNNGKWDTGNYQKGLQAERIYYDKTNISIKAYWDIEQSVDMDRIINN